MNTNTQNIETSGGSRKVLTNYRDTVFGLFGEIDGRKVQFTYSTNLWFYVDTGEYIFEKVIRK